MVFNSSYDSLSATTLDDYQNELSDLVTGHTALIAQLSSMGFKRTIRGGAGIVHQLDTALNGTVKWYSGAEQLDDTPQDPFSAARFTWKQLAVGIGITGLLEFQNSGGDHQLIDVVAGLINNAVVSMREQLNTALFGDGSAFGGKAVTGLALAVEDGAAWSTYGGIDSNLNSAWRNQFEGSVGDSQANLLDKLQTARTNAVRGKTKPTIYITDLATYNNYERLGTALERFPMPVNQRMLDLGFDNLEYKRAPIVADDDCTAGYLYGLNAETMFWNVGSGKDFAMTPFMTPRAQDAKSKMVYLYCNLSMNNRARNLVLTGITNS